MEKHIDTMKTLLLLFQLILFCSIPIMAASDEKAPLEKDTKQMIEVLGCMGCHKIKGEGGSLAADLTLIGSRKTEEQIRIQLTADSASRKKGFMPSYQSLPEKDLRQISSYLYNFK